MSGEGRDFRKSGTRVRYLLEGLEKWASARGGREIPSRRAASLAVAQPRHGALLLDLPLRAAHPQAVAAHPAPHAGGLPPTGR